MLRADIILSKEEKLQQNAFSELLDSTALFSKYTVWSYGGSRDYGKVKYMHRAPAAECQQHRQAGINLRKQTSRSKAGWTHVHYPTLNMEILHEICITSRACVWFWQQGEQWQEWSPKGAEHTMSSEGESLAVCAWCRALLGWVWVWVGVGSCEVGLALCVFGQDPEGGKARREARRETETEQATGEGKGKSRGKWEGGTEGGKIIRVEKSQRLRQSEEEQRSWRSWKAAVKMD